MSEIIKNILANKRFRILAGLLAFYLAFSYWAVNPLAQRILPWVAENKLASQLQVERVQFDPLGLIVTIDNLRLLDQDGLPLAGFEQLHVNLEISGLLRWAWRFHDIRLIAPQVTLDIAPDGRFNWADLLAKLGEDEKSESNTIARVLIDHILIERGNIEYEERNRHTPFKAVLQPLGLELDGLSTLPEDRGEYALLARFPEQGGTLKWKGDLGLNPIISSGSLEIEGIKLAKLMQLVQTENSPLIVTDGSLGTHFNYRFAMAKGETEPFPQARIEHLELTVEQLAADLMTSGNPQASMALEQLRVSMPVLSFSKQADTQLSFNQLTLTMQQFALMQQDHALFRLNQAGVTGVDFDLAANRMQIEEVLLTEGAINTRRDKDGEIDWQQLTAVLAGGDTDAEAVTEPQAATPLGFVIQRVQLAQWQASHQDQGFVHPLSLAAKDINLAFSISNDSGALEISALNSEIGNLDLRSALYRQPVATLTKASLQNGIVNLQDSAASLSAIVLSGLQTSLLIEPDKPLNWQAVLAPLPNKSQPAADSKPASAASPWTFGVDRVALESAGVHVEDKTTRTPTVLDIQNARFELQQVSQDFSKRIPVKASLQVKQGGTLEASGKLALEPMSADLQVKLSNLALKTFSPYLNQAALLKLDSGNLQINGKLALSTEKTLQGQFQGGFSLRQLGISEELTAEPFVTWKEVVSESVRLTLTPPGLHLNELRIVEPAGKFIIHEDGSMNIKRILREPALEAGRPAAEPAADATGDFPVTVERVSIDNANLEFADLTLRPQFGTHINSLTGVINGLSTDAATTAQVELDGKVDEFGSARIRGAIQPFQATDFTDLTLAFHNLEMNRLTPYSGKFAGRRIDSGRLSVDLEYKIKQRQLAGENKFVINKLQLGERIDSPDAVSLPLDLAIALLEDSNGLIDLDLPISGSLDDPQFSYGKIVWKAVVNVLTKIVTSPFRALGKLLGVDSEKMQDVGFDPGETVLAPQEQEKLKALAGAMSERPALTLTLVPAFDPAADKLALQELATRRDVLQEMGVKLQADEQPGPVDLTNTRAQSAVERLLKERTGAGGSLKTVDAIKDYFRKSKPEDLPIYAEMLDQLRATVAISDEALRALADSRVETMQHYLINDAGLDAARVHTAEVSKVESDGKLVPLRMELGVDSAAQVSQP